MTREELKTVHDALSLLNSMVNSGEQHSQTSRSIMELAFEILKNDSAYASLPPAEGAEQLIRVRNILQDFYRRGDYELEQAEEDIMRIFTPQPTAEGAEEILASLVESLGEPDNSVTDHSYEIRPLTVEGKREWWMFHNGVGSGEPLKQWLGKFATLHAQKIADKMVSEKLREELIKYEIHWNFVLRDNAEKVVDEYLKSRESHDNIR